MRYIPLFIISLFLFSGIVPIFAQQANTAPLITTNTDKPSYTIGDTIVISGSVQAVVVGTPLTIQILDPNNNLAQVAQIDVSQDGKYTDTIKAVGTLWKTNGVYTVKVQYGPPNVTAQSTFAFQSTFAPTVGAFQLKDPTSQQTFNVNYTISGGTVKIMTIDAQSLSVIVTINSTSNGNIELQLPRTLIDSKLSSGQDDPFIVVIDGAEVKALSDSGSSNFRNVNIPFLQGDQDIEIIGTWIVPEFGTLAVIIFAVALLAIIGISAKTGLKFMAKY